MGPTIVTRTGAPIIRLAFLSHLQVEAFTGGGRMCSEWVFGPPKKPIKLVYGFLGALKFAEGVAVGRELCKTGTTP